MSMKEEWDKRAHEDAYYYVSSFSNKWAEDSFFHWGEIQTQFVIDTFLDEQDIDPLDLVILEIGCGIGRMSRALASRFKIVHAYDVSPRYIELAKEKNEEIHNISFHVNNGKSFPEIEDETIDFVFSGWTMQHMPTKEIVIENIHEMRRVLKINGFYKIDPAITSSKLLNSLIKRTIESEFIQLLAGFLGINRTFMNSTWRGVRFTKNEILNLLTKEKFSVETRLENDGLEKLTEKRVMRRWFYGKKI